jgi:hypothetical protein
MPNFKTEVLKTRMLADVKQTAIKITNDKGEFEIDDIKGIVETTSFEKTGAKSNKNNNIKTIVRIPTILDPRTVKSISGEWKKTDDYEEYWAGKVAETGKLQKISYIEVTVIKTNGYDDYFS